MSGPGAENAGLASYDDLYRQPGFYWGQEPNDLCVQACSALRAGEDGAPPRAVDLGCGEGRDAIYLARRGINVTAVDISRPGLDKAERWAAAAGLRLRTVQADLNDCRLDGPYDLVYASGAVSFLRPLRRAEVFAHLKAETRPGGVNAFNAFVLKPYLPTPPDFGRDEHFFRSGELLGFYWDWEILRCDEVTFRCSSGGVPHVHAMDVLIARRPASA